MVKKIYEKMLKHISNKENLKESLRYNFSPTTLANVRGMKKNKCW